MPRKEHQAPGLGKALIKDRFGKKKSKSFAHASEVPHQHNDLKSVTEPSNLDDFLATAELAGTEFSSQRMNIHFIDSTKHGVLNESEQRRLEAAHIEYQHLLGIPRRPEWNEKMSKEELDEKERAAFLMWRKQLALMQENENLLLTPYEKTLDFWRQLWRVIERSDVVVQIVDARNPLLFRCKDLEHYVKQVDSKKENILLLNKADLLSAKQRRSWKKYFDEHNVNAIFWSAILENEKLETESKLKVDNLTKDEECENRYDEESESERNDDDDSSCEDESAKNETVEITEKHPLSETKAIDDENDLLLTRSQLIQFFKNLVTKRSKVIGMVGYPNVGKSSTINTLLGIKKVAVSATPGRTKHFQTLFIDSELCLCDCPGLVFPSFVSSKSEMVLNGILPIDQMRDHVGPVNLLSHYIPRKVIEGTYGINITRPKEGEDANRPPNSSEILNAHALSRGFMTSHGQPDNSRSARVILKDFVNGKLLYSIPPPGFDAQLFKSWTISKVEIVLNTIAQSLTITEDMQAVAARINRVDKNHVTEISEVEKEFFNPQSIRTFTAGKTERGVKGNGKKQRNKKKEKIRRVRTVNYH